MCGGRGDRLNRRWRHDIQHSGEMCDGGLLMQKTCGKFVVGAVLMALMEPALSQVNNPAYADYFLVGQFGEICTMCEVIVLCETNNATPGHEKIPDTGDFTLYHLQTRTFWSQISTIWEWFITNFDSDALASSGHKRPVEVYAIDAGRWSVVQNREAHVSLDPATIMIGDRTIDRIDRAWLQGPNLRPGGFCQRLPLWESLEVIAAHAPVEDAR